MDGGGFESGTRAPGHSGPSFEPPGDPAAGGSAHGLSLVARIMRGRGLAADAAGLPPLDSDQVLDLQRSAGNRMTAGALARWTDALEEALDARAAEALAGLATPELAARRPTADLLDHLLPARAADPAAYAAICAVLDARDPALTVLLSCTAAPVPAPACAIVLRGPAGGSCEGTGELVPGATVALELAFSAAFGTAAAIGSQSALELRVAAPDGAATGVELPVPFAAPRALALGAVRLVALAETV